MTEHELRQEWLRLTNEIARAALRNSAIGLSIACLARACVDSAMVAKNFGVSTAVARLPREEPHRYLVLRRRAKS